MCTALHSVGCNHDIPIFNHLSKICKYLQVTCGAIVLFGRPSLVFVASSIQEQDYARLSFFLVIHTGLVLCSLKSERARWSFVVGVNIG